MGEERRKLTDLHGEPDKAPALVVGASALAGADHLGHDSTVDGKVDGVDTLKRTVWLTPKLTAKLTMLTP